MCTMKKSHNDHTHPGHEFIKHMQKTFASSFRTGMKKKERMAIAKPFTLHPNTTRSQ